MDHDCNVARWLEMHAIVWSLQSYLLKMSFRLSNLLTRNRAPALASVAGIIPQGNNNLLLLLHRSDGQGWCLPGGIVRGEESLEEALVREVFEETGFWVEPTCLFGVYSGKRKDPRWPSVCAIFCCRIIGGQEHESPEGKPSWIPVGIAPGLWAFDTERIIDEYSSALVKAWNTMPLQCNSFGAIP